MANNPFLTPTITTPWPIVHSNGKLFNTASRVTRLTTQWASPSGPPGSVGTGGGFAALKNIWNSGSQAVALTGFGRALKYLAAGSSADAVAAHDLALSESTAGETDSPRLYSQSIPYAYAWCKGGLNGTQQNDLLTRIESNQQSLETAIAVPGQWSISSIGNSGPGIASYVYNWCAADGQAGITDRSTNVRNLVQNTVQAFNEACPDGIYQSYDHLFDQQVMMILAFHIATGNESLLATRCPGLALRGEQMARMLSSDGNHQYKGLPHNLHSATTGAFVSPFPAEGYSMAVYSEFFQDATAKWVCDQFLAHSLTGWSHGQINSQATWLGFLFYDGTLTGVSPTTANLTKNKTYVSNGYTQFRSAWNTSTEVVCDFFGGSPGQYPEHSIPSDGCIQIRVGGSWLVSDGYNYVVRRSGENWEIFPFSTTEVGGYTMRSSGPSYSPASTEATRVDRDGSAYKASTPNSATKYPTARLISNLVRPVWDSGVMGALYDDGTLAKVTADISVGFPQCTSATRTVAWRPGGATVPVTIIVYDQFNADATINQVRQNFWSRYKPTFPGSETVLQGSTTAGVVKWSGDKVVHKNGSYQVTIQCVSPFNTINGVGGAGYESFFDAPASPTNGYASSGGANLDFVANGGSAADFLWMNNNAAIPGNIQWRTSFQSTQGTAQGEMLSILTVDANGAASPSYTYNQVKALLSTGPGTQVAMPSFSTFAQKQGLDFMSGNNSSGLPTLYAALFTVLPLDDGTGGTEVSGVSYSRVQLNSNTFSLASGGSPATTTNASTITFPTAGGSWGTVVAVGFFDAATNGNYWGGDYLGTGAWQPFTCTSASPGVLTSPAHGFSNSDTVEVTAKFGGTLPTTGGSWAGALTVASSTTDTFTAGVNTTGTGDGMVRKILSQAVASAATVTIPIGTITLSLG